MSFLTMLAKYGGGAVSKLKTAFSNPGTAAGASAGAGFVGGALTGGALAYKWAKKTTEDSLSAIKSHKNYHQIEQQFKGALHIAMDVDAADKATFAEIMDNIVLFKEVAQSDDSIEGFKNATTEFSFAQTYNTMFSLIDGRKGLDVLVHTIEGLNDVCGIALGYLFKKGVLEYCTASSNIKRIDGVAFDHGSAVMTVFLNVVMGIYESFLKTLSDAFVSLSQGKEDDSEILEKRAQRYLSYVTGFVDNSRRTMQDGENPVLNFFRGVFKIDSERVKRAKILRQKAVEAHPAMKKSILKQRNMEKLPSVLEGLLWSQVCAQKQIERLAYVMLSGTATALNRDYNVPIKNVLLEKEVDFFNSLPKNPESLYTSPFTSRGLPGVDLIGPLKKIDPPKANRVMTLLREITFIQLFMASLTDAIQETRKHNGNRGMGSSLVSLFVFHLDVAREYLQEAFSNLFELPYYAQWSAVVADAFSERSSAKREEMTVRLPLKTGDNAVYKVKNDSLCRLMNQAHELPVSFCQEVIRQVIASMQRHDNALSALKAIFQKTAPSGISLGRNDLHSSVRHVLDLCVFFASEHYSDFLLPQKFRDLYKKMLKQIGGSKEMPSMDAYLAELVSDRQQKREHLLGRLMAFHAQIVIKVANTGSRNKQFKKKWVYDQIKAEFSRLLSESDPLYFKVNDDESTSLLLLDDDKLRLREHFSAAESALESITKLLQSLRIGKENPFVGLHHLLYLSQEVVERERYHQDQHARSVDASKAEAHLNGGGDTLDLKAVTREDIGKSLGEIGQSDNSNSARGSVLFTADEPRLTDEEKTNTIFILKKQLLEFNQIVQKAIIESVLSKTEDPMEAMSRKRTFNKSMLARIKDMISKDIAAGHLDVIIPKNGSSIELVLKERLIFKKSNAYKAEKEIRHLAVRLSGMPYSREKVMFLKDLNKLRKKIAASAASNDDFSVVFALGHPDGNTISRATSALTGADTISSTATAREDRSRSTSFDSDSNGGAGSSDGAEEGKTGDPDQVVSGGGAKPEQRSTRAATTLVSRQARRPVPNAAGGSIALRGEIPLPDLNTQLPIVRSERAYWWSIGWWGRRKREKRDDVFYSLYQVRALIRRLELDPEAKLPGGVSSNQKLEELLLEALDKSGSHRESRYIATPERPVYIAKSGRKFVKLLLQPANRYYLHVLLSAAKKLNDEITLLEKSKKNSKIVISPDIAKLSTLLPLWRGREFSDGLRTLRSGFDSRSTNVSARGYLNSACRVLFTFRTLQCFSDSLRVRGGNYGKGTFNLISGRFFASQRDRRNVSTRTDVGNALYREGRSAARALSMVRL